VIMTSGRRPERGRPLVLPRRVRSKQVLARVAPWARDGGLRGGRAPREAPADCPVGANGRPGGYDVDAKLEHFPAGRGS
jgi:hypothetical protein